jgi:hypothetical protein
VLGKSLALVQHKEDPTLPPDAAHAAARPPSDAGDESFPASGVVPLLLLDEQATMRTHDATTAMRATLDPRVPRRASAPDCHSVNRTVDMSQSPLRKKRAG